VSTPSNTIDQVDPAVPLARASEDVDHAIARRMIQRDAVADQLVSLISPSSYIADQYRSLRHSIERRRNEAGLRTLAVTSAGPGEGKTITTLNLAGAMAQGHNRRILVIDADLRRPSVARYLGLDDQPSSGLSDAIRDETMQLRDVVVNLEGFNLSVLPAGAPTQTPYELLNSPRLENLLSEACRQYDQVIVDTPPVVSMPDCRVIGRLVDGFLVIVAADKTPRKLLAEAMNLLDASKVIGIVFNGAQRPLSNHYGYYHDYYVHQRRPGWWRRAWNGDGR